MLKVSKNTQKNNCILTNLFLLLTSVSGVLFCFADFSYITTLLLVVFSLITCFLAKFKRNIDFFVPLGLNIVFLFVFFKKIINGFLVLTNAVLNLYGEKTLTIVSIFKTEKTDLIYINIFIVLFLTLIFYSAIKFKSVWLYIFTVTAVTAFGIYFKRVKPLGIILLIISLIGLMYKEKLTKINLKIIISTVLIVAITISLSNVNIAFLLKDYEKISSFAENKIYGENVLPNGDFNNIKQYKPSNKTTLKIKMQKPEACYLKGFVGDKFSNNKWQSIDNKTLYKSADLFNSLYKNGFYSQTQIATKQNNKITINNINACKKYKYIPYSLCDKSILNNTINDKNVLNGALNKEYTFYASSIDYSNLKPVSTNEEKHYRDFVYKNYTSLNNENKELIESLIGKYSAKNNTHYSYKNAKEEISKLFSDFKVDKSAVNNSVYANIISNFADSKRGFSVHFASLSALIFRYLGIPARYVEGYVITNNDIINGDINLELSEKNCHAWVEYYQDGIGWLPFEATPNFSEQINLPDNLSVKVKSVDEEKIIKQKQKNKTKSQVNYLKNEGFSSNYLVYILLVLVLIVVLIIALKVKRRNKKEYFELTIRYLNKKGYKTDGYKIDKKFKDFEKAQKVYFVKRFSNKNISLEDELFLKEFYKNTKKQVKWLAFLFGAGQEIRTLETALTVYTISNRAPSASSDNPAYLRVNSQIIF